MACFRNHKDIRNSSMSLLAQMILSAELQGQKRPCGNCMTISLMDAIKTLIDTDEVAKNDAEQLFELMMHNVKNNRPPETVIAYPSSDGSLHRTKDEADLNTYRRAVEAGEVTDPFERWNEQRKTQPSSDAS